MTVGQLLKDTIKSVKDSSMHPVVKGGIIGVCFVGLGALVYFGIPL